MFRPKVNIFVNVVSAMGPPTPHPLHPNPGIVMPKVSALTTITACVVQYNGIDKGNQTLVQPVRKFIISSSYTITGLN